MHRPCTGEMRRSPDRPIDGDDMKKKARKLAKRNPEARELLRNPLFRPKTTKSADAAVAQANEWNRRGKHRRRVEPE